MMENTAVPATSLESGAAAIKQTWSISDETCRR